MTDTLDVMESSQKEELRIEKEEVTADLAEKHRKAVTLDQMAELVVWMGRVESRRFALGQGRERFLQYAEEELRFHITETAANAAISAQCIQFGNDDRLQMLEAKLNAVRETLG